MSISSLKRIVSAEVVLEIPVRPTIDLAKAAHAMMAADPTASMAQDDWRRGFKPVWRPIPGSEYHVTMGCFTPRQDQSFISSTEIIELSCRVEICKHAFLHAPSPMRLQVPVSEACIERNTLFFKPRLLPISPGAAILGEPDEAPCVLPKGSSLGKTQGVSDGLSKEAAPWDVGSNLGFNASHEARSFGKRTEVGGYVQIALLFLTRVHNEFITYCTPTHPKLFSPRDSINIATLDSRSVQPCDPCFPDRQAGSRGKIPLHLSTEHAPTVAWDFFSRDCRLVLENKDGKKFRVPTEEEQTRNLSGKHHSL